MRSLGLLGEMSFPELTLRASREKVQEILRAEDLDFSDADRVLCATDQSLLWLVDRDLREAYDRIDFAAMDRERPIGGR